MYVFVPPPTSYTPLVWGTQMPWIRSMCVFRYEATTVILHSVQLTRVFFQYLNVSPSPVSLHLYAVSPHFPRMNPGVHTIAFVLSMLSSNPILRNLATITVS